MQPRTFSRVARPILIIALTLAILTGQYGFAYAAPGEQKIYYYLPDHLGGIDKVTDEQGNVVCSNDYLPFGDLRRGDCTENDEDYGFTGKERDPETDLYYYGARYYDPQIGRFISPDPWEGDLFDPQTLNKYSYVLNNPLRFIDPTGLINESTGEVEKGDTLIKIAEEYGEIFGMNINYQQLAAINNIGNPNNIKPGDIVLMGTVGANGEIWTTADPRNLDTDFRAGLMEEQRSILDFQRNFYQRDLPQTLTGVNWDEWTQPEISVAHNIGTSGNVEIRGIGPRTGQQAIYDAAGNLVTDPVNMGTFDFASPNGFNVLEHFQADVQPWLNQGNSPADTTNRTERANALMRGMVERIFKHILPNDF